MQRKLLTEKMVTHKIERGLSASAPRSSYILSWFLPRANVVIANCLIFLIIASTISVCKGLKCWQCVDDCEGDPFDNYKATPKDCQEDESCQKTEYRGRDLPSMTEYRSVTRSCSQGRCVPQRDNCTDERLSNPGCMIRHCCSDKNFCNGSSPVHGTPRTTGRLLLTVLIISYIST